MFPLLVGLKMVVESIQVEMVGRAGGYAVEGWSGWMCVTDLSRQSVFENGDLG